MAIEIVIQNIQDKIDITGEMEEVITKAVELCFEHEKMERSLEISILLVDDRKIKEINNEQRGIDMSTDVLSFPIVEMEDGQIKSNLGDINLEGNIIILGDIVVSVETAYKQAIEYGHSFERELAFLVTHGVFHLLGYEHEDKNNENKMREKQEVVLGKMGLKRWKHEIDIKLDLDILVRKATEEKAKAYAPYSGFKVGAAVLTETGDIYTGVNVENISYGTTICAERVAIFKAISDGERKIKAIAIAGDGEEIIYPCGACCQVISEFGGENTKIVCSDNKGDFRIFALKELFPYPFKSIK